MSEEPRESSAQTDAATPGPPLRRRPRGRRRVYRAPRNLVGMLITLVLLLALAVGAGYYVYTERVLAREPFAIVLGGKPVAVLRTHAEAVRVVRDVRTEIAPDMPELVVFSEGEPEIVPYHGLPKYQHVNEAAAALRKRVTPALDGYAIFVNRNPRVILPSKEAAWEAIALMQERGKGDKHGIPTFRERVTIAHLRITLDKAESIIPADAKRAAETLVRPPQKRVHVVQRGDNFWKIATANGMTVNQLIALNPGVDYKSLHDGDIVALPDEPSPVTVVVHELVKPRTTATRPLPKSIPVENAADSAVNTPPVYIAPTANARNSATNGAIIVTPIDPSIQIPPDPRSH